MEVSGRPDPPDAPPTGGGGGGGGGGEAPQGKGSWLGLRAGLDNFSCPELNYGFSLSSP